MHAEDDGAASGRVAAEAATVRAVKGVVVVLGVQVLAGDVAKFAQGGDGWRGWRRWAGLDLVDYLVEGRRVGIVGDGAIEVIGEAAHAAMEPVQDKQSGTAVEGIEEIGRDGVHLGKGLEVAQLKAPLDDDAAEGSGEPALGMGTEVPVQSGGGDGVAGGAAQRDGGGAGFAEGQVDLGAVEE